MKLIFATNNSNKLTELKAAISNFEIQGLSEFGITEDIPETGGTLQENALIKAQFIFEKYGENCFADDTGLEVDALDGAPGVYSARYSGENSNAQKNNEKLLGELKGCENRLARFRTVICLFVNGDVQYFEGICEGEILERYHGEQGFGYDPIFKPKGFDKSFAQMSVTEKNKISHRGLAVQKLIQYLSELK